MRGSARLVLALLFAAGCTRLNPSFSDAESTSSSTGGDPRPTTSKPTTMETMEESAEGSSEDATGTTLFPPATLTGMGESGAPGGCLELFGDCDPYAADTCPDGQRCRPWSDGVDSGVSCVAESSIAQPLTVGDACTHRCDAGYGVDECPPRSICDPTLEPPTCVPLCGAQGACTDGICEEHDGYGLCRPQTCDPLDQDCPDGFGCGLDGLCTPAGKVGPGESCALFDECLPGLVCVGSGMVECLDGSRSCCAPLCDPDSRDCEDGQVCQDFADGIGICVAV